jgi:hypothetical protein
MEDMEQFNKSFVPWLIQSKNAGYIIQTSSLKCAALNLGEGIQLSQPPQRDAPSW